MSCLRIALGRFGRTRTAAEGPRGHGMARLAPVACARATLPLKVRLSVTGTCETCDRPLLTTLRPQGCLPFIALSVGRGLRHRDQPCVVGTVSNDHVTRTVLADGVGELAGTGRAALAKRDRAGGLLAAGCRCHGLA